MTVAWTAFLIGGIVYSLKVVGVLPDNAFTSYAIQAGSAIEVILLSLGLGDRIRHLEKEKEAEKRKLLLIDRELEFARKIQQSTLPGSLPSQDSFSVAALCIPMEKVGGDLYDFHDMGEGRIGVFVSDVSGHGVPAALIASMAKITFEVLKNTARDPSELLREMNRILYGNIENQFLTALYAVIDREEGAVLHARAGHLPLLVLKEGRKVPVEPFPAGKPIGLLPEAEFELSRLPVCPGDRIVFYTDCVVEAENENNVILGKDAFREAVIASAGSSPGEVISSVLGLLRDWTGRKESFDDDFTLIVVDIN